MTERVTCEKAINAFTAEIDTLGDGLCMDNEQDRRMMLAIFLRTLDVLGMLPTNCDRDEKPNKPILTPNPLQEDIEFSSDAPSSMSFQVPGSTFCGGCSGAPEGKHGHWIFKTDDGTCPHCGLVPIPF